MDTIVREGNLGIFSYNGQCIIRKLKIEGKNPVLEAFNENYSDIYIDEKDEFYILARVVEAGRDL
jgi:SOS-response transcriptional repressor LexA